ncbi:MAG: hypothetical protein JW828_10945 [Sedimentisphaerales bacterium]|nr:hypothetical protein [Sedimentisphaerales bacterium]
MVFRLYTKQISQATRGLAAGIFIVGMLLIGFAMLIFALPELFAYLAAGVFFFIGLVTLGYALRLFIAASSMDRHAQTMSDMPADEAEDPLVRRKKIEIKVEQDK